MWGFENFSFSSRRPNGTARLLFCFNFQFCRGIKLRQCEVEFSLSNLGRYGRYLPKLWFSKCRKSHGNMYRQTSFFLQFSEIRKWRRRTYREKSASKVWCLQFSGYESDNHPSIPGDFARVCMFWIIQEYFPQYLSHKSINPTSVFSYFM